MLQDDLFNDGPVIVVGPLFDARLLKPTPRLNPVFEIDGKVVVLSLLEIASTPRAGLRSHVTNLDAHRDQFVAAIDLLFIGI